MRKFEQYDEFRHAIEDLCTSNSQEAKLVKYAHDAGLLEVVKQDTDVFVVKFPSGREMTVKKHKSNE